MHRLVLIALLVGGLFTTAIEGTRASPANGPAHRLRALSVARAPANQTTGTVAVCKIGADTATQGQTFTFGLSVPGTFAGSTITTIVLNAGTTSAPSCSSPIIYPANTGLIVTENGHVGFQVASITINGGTNVVTNVPAGTASFVTGTGAVTVTFTNALAATTTPTTTATATSTATATATSVSPTVTGTATPTPTATRTSTPLPTATSTPAPPTATATPVPPTNTPIPPAPTNTPKPSKKPTATATTPAPPPATGGGTSPPAKAPTPIPPPKTLPNTGFAGLNGALAHNTAMGREYRAARGQVALGSFPASQSGSGSPIGPAVPVVLGLLALGLGVFTRKLSFGKR